MRVRKPSPIDTEHMRILHQEAIEQLELMKNVIEAAESASDATRDNLDKMAIDHWHAYMDVIHMLCMHDSQMSNAMKQHGMTLKEDESDKERFIDSRRNVLLLLLIALSSRHRRFDRFLSTRGNPMTEYLQSSIAMEREHAAKLVSMVDNMI